MKIMIQKKKHLIQRRPNRKKYFTAHLQRKFWFIQHIPIINIFILVVDVN